MSISGPKDSQEKLYLSFPLGYLRGGGKPAPSSTRLGPPGCAEMKSPSFALITGASQGLGRVFARALAARGQNVILVARSRDKLESLANELRSCRLILAEVFEFDLASPWAGQRLAQQLRDRNLKVN